MSYDLFRFFCLAMVPFASREESSFCNISSFQPINIQLSTQGFSKWAYFVTLFSLLLSFHLQGKQRTPSVSANHSDFQVFPKRYYFPALCSETVSTLLALPHALFFPQLDMPFCRWKWLPYYLGLSFLKGQSILSLSVVVCKRGLR